MVVENIRVFPEKEFKCSKSRNKDFWLLISRAVRADS